MWSSHASWSMEPRIRTSSKLAETCAYVERFLSLLEFTGPLVCSSGLVAMPLKPYEYNSMLGCIETWHTSDAEFGFNSWISLVWISNKFEFALQELYSVFSKFKFSLKIFNPTFSPHVIIIRTYCCAEFQYNLACWWVSNVAPKPLLSLCSKFAIERLQVVAIGFELVLIVRFASSYR